MHQPLKKSNMVSNQIFRKTFSLHNKTTQTYVACEESQKRCWCFTVLFLISYQNHVLPSHKQTAELQQSKKKPKQPFIFPPTPPHQFKTKQHVRCLCKHGLYCTELYLHSSCTRLDEKRKKKKKFLNFLTNFTLKKKKETPPYPHHPQSITFTYSNPGRDVLNKTRLLLVKFENKGRFHAERRDDYQSDTLWATCQHYAVKNLTFPPPFKSSSDTKRLMQH